MKSKTFWQAKSLTGLFLSMVMLFFFLSFLNAVSDSPWRSGHIEVQNWANGPQCSWLCTSFMNFLCSPNLRPILTMLCKVFDIHIRNSSPSHQITCFILCMYHMSFLKLIPVWIDSEPNSCQWNSTLAHWGCHINKKNNIMLLKHKWSKKIAVA